MKKILIIFATIIFCVGCDNRHPVQDTRTGWLGMHTTRYLIEETKILKDGRRVICLVYKDNNSGGMSCDWNNAITHLPFHNQ